MLKFSTKYLQIVRRFVIRETRYANYRVAVGPLIGRVGSSCDLPCLSCRWTKLGRRSWSFYVWTICLWDANG